VDYDETARWLVVRRGRLRIMANMAPVSRPVPLDRPPAGLLAASGPGVTTGAGMAGMPATSFAGFRT
jgi:maltooligosyltrehalose trehalohydrolase